ncbi:hypothetical protein ACWEQ7_31065 [Streptomyces sp. NPDC004069]
MTLVPGALLALAATLGCVPVIAASLAPAAAVFTDRGRYAAAVLTHRASAPAGQVPAAGWTATGVALGLLSTGIAVALAVTAVRRRAPRLSARHPAARAVRALRRLHSGRLGDYLAWLALGIAVLCAALAVQS